MLHLALLASVLFFCFAVIYGALSDVATFTIPNWVSYLLIVAFVGYAAVKWEDIPVVFHIALALATFLMCMVFWHLKWLGGGDVKFLAAISLWMGPDLIAPYLLLLCLISALFVLVLRWARNWRPWFEGGSWPKVVKRLVEMAEQNACPYGLPAGIAALIIVPEILS
jgi:prepilin peptidase CpaA